MPAETPQLPARFPCWCQAVYSWGGETKKDLGFVEGDLIECLNAGDGAWWMGRLRRDQRMVGLFPSNFVKVLDENFSPEKARKVSNAAAAAAAANANSQPQQKPKTVFRKPFQGYKEAVGPSEALRQKKEAKEASIATSIPDHRLALARKRSATRPQRPTSKPVLRRSNSPAPAPAPTHPPGSRGSSSSGHSRPRRSSRISPPLSHASQQPERGRNGHQVIFNASQQLYPHSQVPSRQSSPAYHAQHRQPSRTTSSDEYYSHVAHKQSQSLGLLESSYGRSTPQSSRDDALHQAPTRKRSGTFPRARHDELKPRPSMLSRPSRLPPPEPLAPASPEHRAPSPYSIFARSRSPIEHSSVAGLPLYNASRALVRVAAPGNHYDPFGEEDEDEAPPPPPPPHRTAVGRPESRLQRPESRALGVPAASQRYDTNLRTPSPASHGRRSAEYDNTPSPLRDAMEDVMTSLQDMGLSRGFASSPDVSPEPYQTWSSQEFDAQDSSRPTTPGRPQTKDSWKANGSGAESTNAASATAPFDRTLDGPPQLNNYVQRMESRLRQLHAQDARKGSDELHLPRRTEAEDTVAPLPPSTRSAHMMYKLQEASAASKMAKRRSAYDVIGRSSTTRSDGTSSSNGMHSTITFSSTSSRTSAEHSLMSGMSAGAYSATSAGSFAKRSFKRPNTSMDIHTGIPESSESPIAVKSDRYNESPSRQGASSAIGWTDSQRSTPARDSLKKKSGFFRKMIESAKSTAANARSARAPGSMSPAKSRLGSAFSHSRSGTRASTRESVACTGDWVQARRDVNRAVTPSKLELIDRAERCQMMDFPVIYAIEDLYATAEGDEGIDGLPIEEPAKWAANNFGLVDKNARLLNSFPPNLSPASLAQSHVCRPHKTDLQRLRAIFTWVAEKIIWEEDIDEEVDVRRIVQIRRGSAREVAVLVQEMCAAVGLHCEVVAGHLKTPGEDLDLDCISFPNHFWNTILIDGEWRIMDCSLASPTHPSRGLYSNAHPHMAESWYFLVRPMEICYSHVPLSPEHQHIVPPVATDVLLALPAVTPAYFQCGLTFASYDTSLTRIDGLEAVQIRVEAPFDIEVAAEVETQALPVNVEGQLIQTGETRTKRALSQPDWCQGRKRYTLKAVLPESDDHGVLKVYAGKRGLMHSSKDIPYPLAFALPIVHTGDNPPYDFVLRHPTPHAQQRDLYILQPQCAKLSINNTFVFTVRQHPASLFPAMPAITTSGSFRTASPLNRPPSSLSMVSSVANYSTTSSTPSSAQQALLASSSNLSSNSSGSHVRKPAKLAIQSPSGKIMRLTRKMDNINGSNVSEQPQEPDGSLWETVIKIGERGTWRALVLADTSNKWCVWAEWEAV